MRDGYRTGPARPLVEASPHPACVASVVIPVRDEAEALGATLAALADQVDLAGRPLDRSTFEVIVLANNCRDGSAGLARRFAEARPGLTLHVVEREIPARVAHVGTARRLLMDEACRRLLGLGRVRGVIASTDGDTRVAPSWLAATLAEVAGGADAVGGDIRTDRPGRSALGRPSREAYLVDVAYRRCLVELEARVDPDPADPWPRHHHQTGASLAVTAGAYRRVGGLPPLPSSEDLALVEALRRADLKLRHSPKVRVVTSARRIGRAGGGMADTLRIWSVSGPTFLVEHPARSEARFARRRRLRDLWREAKLGRMTGRPSPDLASLLDAAATFGRLLESVEEAGLPVELHPSPEVDVLEALKLLRGRLAELRRPGLAAFAASRLLEEVDPIRLLPAPAPMA